MIVKSDTFSSFNIHKTEEPAHTVTQAQDLPGNPGTGTKQCNGFVPLLIFLAPIFDELLTSIIIIIIEIFVIMIYPYLNSSEYNYTLCKLKLTMNHRNMQFTSLNI